MRQTINQNDVAAVNQDTGRSSVCYSMAEALNSELPEVPALDGVLDAFPRVRHAFSYGSGVFPQPGLYGKNGQQGMIDFIFVVESPASWHYLVSSWK